MPLVLKIRNPILDFSLWDNAQKVLFSSKESFLFCNVHVQRAHNVTAWALASSAIRNLNRPSCLQDLASLLLYSNDSTNHAYTYGLIVVSVISEHECIAPFIRNYCRQHNIHIYLTRRENSDHYKTI